MTETNLRAAGRSTIFRAFLVTLWVMGGMAAWRFIIQAPCRLRAVSGSPTPAKLSRGGPAHAMPASSSRMRILGSVRDFELMDSRGRSITREDLFGRVWVADFIFTSCAGTCPLMNMRMQALQEDVQDPDVRFVSISCDPDRDTPERLAEYARKLGADTDRWWFLTGDKSVIHPLSIETFHLALVEPGPEELQPGGQAILHSQRFVLVDRRCRIRGMYDGTERRTIALLAEDIRTLLNE